MIRLLFHFSSLYKVNKTDSPIPGYMNESMLCAGMGQLGGMYPFMLERFDMLCHMHINGAAARGLNVTDSSVPECFMRNYKNYTDNVYVDTHSMSESAIRCAVEVLGEDKILFGSDLPITPQSWGIERGIATLKGSQLPEITKKKILGENAQKLLSLS